MNRAFIVAAALAGFGICVPACPAGYVFKKIADSTQGYSNFGLPVVNDNGLVAFRAAFGGQGNNLDGLVFTGSGGPVTMTASPIVFYNPAINHLGQIAVVNGQSVDRIDGSTVTTVATYPVVSFQSVAIDNSGTIFFSGFSTSAGAHASLGSSNGGPITWYVGPSGAGSSGRAAINSLSQAAVNYGSAAVTEYISFNGINVLDTSVARYNGIFGVGPIQQLSDVAVNKFGTILFSANYNGFGQDLFMLNNGQLQEIAEGRAEPAINDNGIVAALFASSNPGSGQIMAGVAAPTGPVISVGDSFMGSTVSQLGFIPQGLSNGNQLTFYAQLANETDGIYVTTVPEPCLGILLSLVCAPWFRRRAISL